MKTRLSFPRAAALAALLPGLFALTGIAHAADSAALARELVDRGGVQRGLCAVLGGEDDLAVEMAKASELVIHAREPRSAAVNRLRTAAGEAGFPMQRLAVERGSLDSLPYATNSVDLVVTTRADAGLLKKLDATEVRRALRPGGVAIIGRSGVTGDPDELDATLRAWAADENGVEAWQDAHGTWLAFTKPPLEGADDWSHWEKSPDNNPVSNDALIKAPYMTQYMATPFYIGMPAITTAAGGRTFLAVGHIAHHEREWGMLNRLIVRNGYNGIVLWERELPEDYLVHRSAFVATEDIFYMMQGDECLRFDARTGEELASIRIPGLSGQWKWMGQVDGVLYVLAGEPGPGAEKVLGTRAFGGWSWADLSKGYYPDRYKSGRIPHGFGDAIAAFDLESKKTLWIHREDSLIDARGLAIRGDRFFLYCPDKHLKCIHRLTAKERWTNADADTLAMIEEPGKGLTSTPGWRTQTLIVAMPEVLVIQGQTRNNVLGVSPKDGQLLWTRQKVTNNPNAIFVDGTVVVGVGPGGRNVALDPTTGETVEDLGFTKRACTRLTASTDSLFCRGEGMTRFDRETRSVMIDGAVRPACNDGVIPAHGLLYLGPWSCDCNLSLIGNVARCSAGDFRFDHEAGPDRLETPRKNHQPEPLEVTDRDWPTYRHDNERSAGTRVPAKPLAQVLWTRAPERPFVPTEPVAAGGLIFFGGDDGVMRALDADTGFNRWSHQSAGVIKAAPTIWKDRALFGSGDGWVYCLEAASGKLLWRFRAAPVERHLMVYGALSSTWPVHSGVLVDDAGTAYFAAGIIDHDGTYVYAIDAETGALKWQNGASGHLNEQHRKGVSAQGNLTLSDGKLLLAGGNVISPAAFDAETGACLEEPRANGQPQSNGGKFIGVLDNGAIIAGGRILHASPRNVATKGSFDAWSPDGVRQTLAWGGIPPAWDDKTFAVSNMKYGHVTALDTKEVRDRLGTRPEAPADRRNRFNNTLFRALTSRGEEAWQSSLGDQGEFEPVSLVVTPNAVVTVAQYQDLHRARAQWFVTALARDNGRLLTQQELPGEPLPGGLLVDRDGATVVTLLDGSAVRFGTRPVAGK